MARRKYYKPLKVSDIENFEPFFIVFKSEATIYPYFAVISVMDQEYSNIFLRSQFLFNFVRKSLF